MKRVSYISRLSGMFSLFLLLSVGWTWAGTEQAPASPKGPIPALMGLTAEGGFSLSKADRCPVCGMFPARRPQHAAAMVLKDGRTYYFCGNGCLLKAWRKPSIHLNVSAAWIDTMKVHDYFSGDVLDAQGAWWVIGSDVIGPMGRAIVALGSLESSKAFTARHGGSKVFQLGQLNRQQLDTLLDAPH